MKKLFTLLVIASLPYFCFAQHPAIENFYEKYEGLDGFNEINIGSWLLQMAINASYDDESKNKKNHISHLRILTSENGNPVTKTDLSQLMKKLRRDDFEDVITIRDGSDRINFFLREEGDFVTDILMTVHGDEGFFLFSLEGLIRLKDLENLDIEFDGSNHLKKLNKYKQA